MNASVDKKSIFSPARIVALLLIGIVVAGLAYLRFAPGDDAVSVPSGAKAGDLRLEPCDYSTEAGKYAADCGTLVVPENRADPNSRLIALPVMRVRSRSAKPAEPIFHLEGGPGGTNMEFPFASRFTRKHDVVLVGYRGVDGSVRLDCPEVTSALRRSKDFLGEESFRAYENGFRDCAERLTGEGNELAQYGLVQQVDDVEAAREALGYDRINLLSESAGTRTAMIYGWRYPQSISRSVMMGVNPPGNYLWNPKATDEVIGRYAELCAKDESCGRRADDLAATLRATEIPERWGFLPIKDGNVRVASFLAMMESTSETPFSGPVAIDAWLSAAEGDASGLWFSSLVADVLLPNIFVWGQYAAAGTVDTRAAGEYFSRNRDSKSLGYKATSFMWGGGLLADAWPAAAETRKYDRVRRSNVETLLVGGELDITTPPQIATKQLLPYLPNGREIVLPAIGHNVSFWHEQPEAGTHLLNTYFDTGRVDDSRYGPQAVDFTPSLSFGGVAKIIVAAMLSLAALTVFSLALMARRLARRGAYGRKASAVLRSVYPVVLGLGGWFLGVLIVLTTMPTVPIDHELLAGVSVGAPIGLGVYFAWANRDWTAATKLTGLAAAVSGALVGAWLGFNATEGLAALLATIAGAAVGANLTLIGLDIAWDRQARDRFAAPTQETLEARPSTG
jgi:pimeloyl-ACP methyl ester carboxylesterase